MGLPGDWHALAPAEALRRLGVDPAEGLDAAEAARRLAAAGPNEIADRGRKSPVAILGAQFASVLVALLGAAAGVAFFLGERTDGATILAILVLNALLGFRQEYRAERAMEALKRLAVPTARVRRGGRRLEIPAREVVPGDVVELEAGSLVPADCRLVGVRNLAIQESALTGESAPVEKATAALADADAPLADRRNMAYMGTAVVRGRGAGIVTATGMGTALGSVAGLMRSVRRDATPLQKRLDAAGRVLAAAAVLLAATLFGAGLLRGDDPGLLLLTALSLAVAAVPEGLPAVVTICLALGAERMLARRALVRRLAAVETLGSVTVIGADKTGTVTGNRMAVVALEAGGVRIGLSREPGPGPAGSPGDRAGAATMPGPAVLLLAAGALCNDAEEEGRKTGEGGGAAGTAAGDPTEVALLAAAGRMGLDRNALARALPRVAEVPFDADRRRMATVHEIRPPPSGAAGESDGAAPLRPFIAGSSHVVFAKGAPSAVLGASVALLEEGGPVPLDPARREALAAAADRMAAEGMRVLAAAYRSLDRFPPGTDPGAVEGELVYVGLAGMIDPPRPEAGPAVAACRGAGIRPVMITGDHPLTARAVARAAGFGDDGAVLTGRDLDALDDAALDAAVLRISVFARVTPDHKLRIVESLKRRGHVVAMTGDGVNDGPALRKADIGVAMGAGGTDVAREAADMVLRDDNFATIVAAVEEGRVIDDNIRKFLRFILGSNVGEILVMVVAPFLGMPLPLLPLQILWVNLVTDGLPAIALAVEPPAPDVMKRPPRPAGIRIFDGPAIRAIALTGAAVGAVTLAATLLAWREGASSWRTLAFTTLTFAQMAVVLSVRAGDEPFLRSRPLRNPALLLAVALTVALQFAVVYLPPFQGLFRTVPLRGAEVAAAGGAAALLLLGLELAKTAGRRPPAGGGG